MLSFVDTATYRFATLSRRGEPTESTRYFEPPPEGLTRTMPGRIGSLVAAAKRVTGYDRQIRRLADEIAEYAIAERIDRIWAVCEMTAVIDVCHHLMKRLPATPFLAHVWDDVEHICWQRRLDRLTRSRTTRRFGSLLAQAERTAVIGEAMAAEYEQRYNARCQIVRHGVTDEVEPRDRPRSDTEFRIGFSGGMYAPLAWQALLDALETLEWQVGERRVRLLVLGSDVRLRTRGPANVEFLGWQPPEVVKSMLSKCDLLYLPQPFGSALQPLSRLSFPTKLSMYVSSGCPVLIHTPEYGSLVEFARQHELPSVCTTLNIETLAGLITSLATDSDRFRKAAAAAARVAQTVLSHTTFREQTQMFLAEEIQPETRHVDVAIASR